MKFHIYVLLFSLFAFSWTTLNQSVHGLEISFLNGNEYHYWYEGQILIGITEDNNQFSGLKVQCLAKVLLKKTGSFMQLEQISVGRINAAINSPPSDPQPFSIFNKISGEEGKIYEEHLSKTIKFKYENGLVREVQSQNDDALWSVNIKKGILSTLQVNHQRKLLDSEEIGRLKNKLKTPDDEKYYRVMEDGIGGECETIYTIQNIPDKTVIFNPDVIIYNVTKLRNYKNCLDKPIWKEGLFTEKNCQNCKDKETELLDSNTRGWYGLRGIDKELIIESVAVNGQHVFQAYNEKGGSITAFVTQLLNLKSSGTKITVDVKSFQNPVLWKNLHYRFFNMDAINEMDNKKSSKIKDSEEIENIIRSQENLPSYDDKKKLMMKLMHGITFGLSETIKNMDVLQHMETMRTLMQFTTLNEIQELYIDIKQQNNDKLRDSFFDILASVGTKPSFRFLREMIASEELKGNGAGHVLALMAITLSKPNEDIIDEQISLCGSDVVKKNSYLMNTCWLTLGTWIHSACVYQNSHKESYLSRRHVVCSSEARERYYKVLVDNISSDKSKLHRSLFLKVLGNAGLEESLEDIQQVINDGRNSRNIRVDAIYSLRRTASQQQQKVLGVLLPIFQNIALDHELRIAAFVIIMDTRPSLTILKMIGQKLQYEQNEQVGSYVYSYFTELSNYTQPCFEELARDVRTALQFTKPMNTGRMDSKTFQSSLYYDKLGIGAAVSGSFIGGANNGIFPRAANLKLNAQVLGYSMNFIEVGLRFEEFQRTIDKIFENKQKKSVFDFVRKSRHTNIVDKEMKEFKEKVNFRLRQFEETTSSFYFKLFGNEIYFKQFTEETIKEYLKKGTIPVGDLEKKLKTGIPVDITESPELAKSLYMISTEIGLPVRLDVHIPAVISLQGTIKGSVDPAMFAGDRDNKSPKKITLELDLKLNIISEVFGKVGVYGIYMDNGMAIDSKLKIFHPISGKVDYDLETATYTIKIDAPEEKRELLLIETKCQTYSLYIPKIIGGERPPFDTQIVEPISKKTITEECSFGEDQLGVKFTLQKKFVPLTKKYQSPLFIPLSGHHYFKIIVDKVAEDKKQTTQFEIQFKHKTYSMLKADDEDPDDVFSNMESEELSLDRSDLPAYMSRYLHSCNIKIICKGITERSINFESLVLSYEKNIYNRFDIKLERNIPFLEPLKLCAAGEIKYPHKLNWEYDDSLQRAANGYAYLQWGTDCGTESEITFKLTANKSKEALDFEKKESLGSDNGRLIYSQCQADRKDDRKFSRACAELMKHYYKLENYILEVNYEKIPAWFRNITHKTARLLRNLYLQYADINDVDVKNKADEILIKAVLGYNNSRSLNMEVFYPRETARLQDIQLPIEIQPLSIKDHWKMSMIQSITNNRFYPSCTIMNNELRTFDGHVYNAHICNCFHIIARDCSPNEHFTILAAKTNGPMENSKELRIYIEGHKLEILPILQPSENYEWVLRIDGTPQKLKNGNTIHYYEIQNDPESKCIFYIILRDNVYFVKIMDLDLAVKFDGVYIKIMTKTAYRGRLCGMCGDMNSDENNEFSGPDGKEYTDGKQFSMSYVIPGDQCNMDNRQGAIPKDNCVAVLRNKRLTRQHQGEQQTCFSTEPIIECPPGCEKLPNESRNLNFHCLSSKDKATKNLIKESKERVLKNLANRKIHLQQSVSAPSGCANED